jgi:hypothetical protein
LCEESLVGRALDLPQAGLGGNSKIALEKHTRLEHTREIRERRQIEEQGKKVA